MSIQRGMLIIVLSVLAAISMICSILVLVQGGNNFIGSSSPNYVGFAMLITSLAIAIGALQMFLAGRPSTKIKEILPLALSKHFRFLAAAAALLMPVYQFNLMDSTPIFGLSPGFWVGIMVAMQIVLVITYAIRVIYDKNKAKKRFSD